MTVSIRRLSLGAGFAYLMGSIARSDAPVSTGPAGSSLTRYYAESGTPPGRWLGTGLAGLNDGHGLPTGTVVSEEGLWRLLGMLADPVTGQPLGTRPRRWPTPAPTTDGERSRGTNAARPVAGFDLTFSVPKSVSTVWALADPVTQQAIYRAHHDAINIALGWMEQQVVFTRTGRNGTLQEPVRGVVAAAFDHWDSRAGDPHLHTHVVIANRVQTLDGRWRTLDSKTLHRYTVAVSELHEGVLHDLLTQRLGYAWTGRSRRHSPVPRYDITGVPTDLMESFSQRSTAIAAEKDDLVAGFAATHGRHPTNIEILRLRQQATLATRPDKTHSSLQELCGQWRDRATDLLHRDPITWVRELSQPVASPASIGKEMVDGHAAAVLGAVSARRATFAHANVLAETHRQLHGLHFSDPAERLQTADAITHRALAEAVLLNPPDPTRPELRLHRGADLYTTTAIFDAETRLLDAGRDTTAPTIPPPEPVSTGGVTLGPDQAAAVTDVAVSGRRLDLLIGPAGTGKTTSLRALRNAWEDYYGPGSVVGLAPSAVAAEVLGGQLQIPTENTSKWLLEHARTPERDARIARLQALIGDCSSLGSVRARRLTTHLHTAHTERDRWLLRPGQLLILDEASLASTTHLDALTTHATQVGAKVLLVGDPAQLGPVDAGGAFTMLTGDRDPVAELTDPRRFTETWERDATLQLRAGDPAVIATYEAHGRIHSGTHDQALTGTLQRWAHDRDAGLDTVMIAADHDTVTALNHAARARLIRLGTVTAHGVPTADGAAGVGDRIITRHNNRTLTYGPRHGDWVRNGDTWTITTTHDDGSLTAVNDTGATIHLPADYVREHVDLGYAITAHQAQGRTLDTAHVIVTERTTREALYVAATRGRRANTLHIDHDTNHEPTGQRDADQILRDILTTSTTDTSAHAALDAIGDGRGVSRQFEAARVQEYDVVRSATAEASSIEAL